MRFTNHFLLAGLALVATTAPAPAQAQDPTTAIYHMYQAYLGRDPHPNEVGIWQDNLARRRMSLLDVHANILGSEDPFNRSNRNPHQFMNAVFAHINARYPSPQELNSWARAWERNRGDRVRWAKEVLRPTGGVGPQVVSLQQLNQPSLAQQPPYQPYPQQPDYSAQQPYQAQYPQQPPQNPYQPQQPWQHQNHQWRQPPEPFEALTVATSEMLQASRYEIPGPNGDHLRQAGNALLQTAQGLQQSARQGNRGQLQQLYQQARQLEQSSVHGIHISHTASPETRACYNRVVAALDTMAGHIQYGDQQQYNNGFGSIYR